MRGLPENAPLLYSPEQRLLQVKSALLVVDLQNDFCAPGGYISKLGRDISNIEQIVPCIERLVEEARFNAVPVIWLTAQYDDDLIPAPMLAKKRERGIAAVCCAKGSWGAQPFGVSPVLGEPIVVKHSYDGFHDTSLDALLQNMAIETLVIVGVQTNVCVESTIRHAHSLGYYVLLATDCVMSHMEIQHHASLGTIEFVLGDLIRSDRIASLWRTRRAADREPEQSVSID